MSDHEQAVAQDESAEVNSQAQEATVPQEETAGDELLEAGQEVSLNERVAELEKERDEYLDQWRRSAAEFQNYRKREERMRGERERSANVRLLRKLLPILDDLQRAAKHVPETITDNEWVQGMLAIERKVWNVLEQEGVTTIGAEPGTEFNPNLHEALISQPSEEYESGEIVEELERGYRHHDNVLRPARVSVAQ